MLQAMRQRAKDERGFTLIELLVVILIIGILAAIAIPSFISQKDKAGDASAKSYARNLQTAQETYFTDNNTYANGVAALVAIEPALNTAPDGVSPPAAADAPVAGTANTYSVGAKSKAGVTYTIARDATGAVTRNCDKPGTGGCPAGGKW
jgi:type IV pilus assembly protein PilA